MHQRPIYAYAGQRELQARKEFEPYRLAFFSCVTQPLRMFRALEAGELVGEACAGLIGENLG